MTTITKEFTKEQLIEQAKKNIEVLRVAVERVPGASDAAVIHLKLAEITLASLEAEPVAYIFKHPAGKLFWALTDESNKEQSDVIPVYAAPPVPVVPEEKPMPNPLKMYAVDAVAAIAEVRGWNACRAAMLKAGNSPVTPGGWISCSELMPEDGQHVIILCDGAFVLYAQYRDGEFFDIVRNGDEFFETQSRNVTDWMPLP
ncbi:DUF551 domain-containing protein, partial [Escherichia albertii]|nr:DUF551 domain-containing protein [Escherichia albertii]